MIGQILKSAIKNFQVFLVIWVVILILNQLFIFGGCFKSYCLLAALPHTGIIAAILTFFSAEEKEKTEGSKVLSASDISKHTEYKLLDNEVDEDDIEEVSEPFCPKCGSKMVLRTAKRGKYAGKKFWGCSNYPKCNGILQI